MSRQVKTNVDMSESSAMPAELPAELRGVAALLDRVAEAERGGVSPDRLAAMAAATRPGSGRRRASAWSLPRLVMVVGPGLAAAAAVAVALLGPGLTRGPLPVDVAYSLEEIEAEIEVVASLDQLLAWDAASAGAGEAGPVTLDPWSTLDDLRDSLAGVDATEGSL